MARRRRIRTVEGQGQLPGWWTAGRSGPALARFGEYRLRALDLEGRKERARRGPRGMRAIHRAIMLMDEAALDEGWRDVGLIAEGYADSAHTGDEAAEVVASHYLFGEGWHDVAAESGMGYDEAKKLAYRALLWLDGGGAT